jgi:uncharacterized protein YhfF
MQTSLQNTPHPEGPKQPARINDFWQAYLAFLAQDLKTLPDSYSVWSFCDNEKDANELGRLVKSGIKTATSSLIWEYEAENAPLPKAGDLSIITNWAGAPLCIIETTQIQIRAFNEVDADFASDEGEGDRSLQYWRTVHWDVYSRSCAVLGREACETMPLLCEHFRVVFNK